MKEVYFIDQTLRDGHQSLWATRMTTPMMLPIAPVIDEAGYKYVDLIGTVHADACVRYLRENPFERMRLLSRAMPRTPLMASVRSRSITGFDIFPDSVVEFWIKRCAANGIRLFYVFEALHDFSVIAKFVRFCQANGLETAVPLVYSLNPVYTDEFYTQKAAEIASDLKPDRIYLKDSIGLLTPDRVRTLIPAIQRNIGEIPFEVHSHCTTGLAPLCCLEAVQLGVDTVHTCALPLANGTSHPSIENMIWNLRRLGYTPMIDEEAVEAVSAHFRYVARREGKPMGAPVEYDAFQYQHQVPGGMMTNLKFMLSQRGMENRLDEVLEEISRIVVEWGYPVMITPYSQIVGTQAVLNVLLGKRYQVASKEAIRYLLGHYAKPPAPVDQNVVDKVTSLPEAKDFLNWEQPQPSIEDLRREIGRPWISDDELLLRILFPEEHVDATLAAGPISTDYPCGDKPVMALLKELTARKDLGHVQVQKEDFSLTLRKGG